MFFDNLQKDISSFLREIFEDVDIPSQDYKVITGYALAMLYKTILELLLGLNGDDKEMNLELLEFFAKHIKKLNPEKRNVFDVALNGNRKKVLKELLTKYIDNLPEKMKKQVKENIQRKSLDI